MNQAEQMLREAWQAIETVLWDAYHRHFAECCGRGQGGCCGDFIEQWAPEDHKILDTLSPIQRKLSQALAAEYTPPPEEYTPPKPAKLVRLTEEDVCLLAAQYLDITPRSSQIYDFASAIIDAIETKNKGQL